LKRCRDEPTGFFQRRIGSAITTLVNGLPSIASRLGLVPLIAGALQMMLHVTASGSSNLH